MKKEIIRLEQKPVFKFLIKWLLISIPVGLMAGLSSALFLWLLDKVTFLRESNHLFFLGLPFGGLLIGWIYQKFGTDISAGNNLILQEYYQPIKTIPFKMAPMVLFGTLVTHLFGGSAGREGTAVQMSAAMADQLRGYLPLTGHDRKLLLATSISAGFSAVFGTPLAGTLFGLEVLVLGRMRYEALLPALFSAIIADKVCRFTGISHAHYYIPYVPPLDALNFFYAVIAGIIFGLIAFGFSKSLSLVTHYVTQIPIQPMFRPFAGGFLLTLFLLTSGLTQYAGLGLPVIEKAFNTSLPFYDFMAKWLLTAFTLGTGFKGGEVTPLFFIGATAGNTLSHFISLPMALLAGMGFVGVFSGATNTPIACTVMGIELFGADCGMYMALACTCAYFFSGHSGIYGAQLIGSPKHVHFSRYKGSSLKNIKQTP